MEDPQGSLLPSISPNSPFSSSYDPNPLSIDSELWQLAEQRTQEILLTIQPALASEVKRKEVIQYVQMLIRRYYSVEILPFGSVPLRTYLPDGDIDLTVLSHQHMEEELASEICMILERDLQDPNFQIKDVQYIQAQVKVVKCSVKDVSVDISFNQTAGLCSLFFLEEINQLIGKDHLLKRSIILIKGWCFYESRILGANYGLISTYALEVLVLYIINRFHSSLPGPLAVLYKFLEYYSTFDWDNYCVSINGLIPVSSLPEIMVEPPEKDGDVLLLNQEFLRKCRETFFPPIKALEKGSPEFPVKYLNIVDPLKNNNNLGRCTNKGTLHRIKCALSYGAKRLREILMLADENMGAALEDFFVNTLNRNGVGQRPDAQIPVPAFGTGRSEQSDLAADFGNYYSSVVLGEWCPNCKLPVHQICSPESPPFIQQKGVGNSLSQLLHYKPGFPFQKDVFVPSLPFWFPSASPYPVNSNVDWMTKSRGTGTYIPDMSHHPYKMSQPYTRRRKADSKTHYLSVASSRNDDHGEGFVVTEKTDDRICLDLVQDNLTHEMGKTGDDSCFNFSLDQFPLLPCSEKCNSRPSGSIGESCASNCCSSRVRRIEFGNFTDSPLLLELPVSTTRKEAESRVSTSFQSMPSVSKVGMQKQQKLSESDRPVAHGKEYQLKDDSEFPPLSI